MTEPFEVSRGLHRRPARRARARAGHRGGAARGVPGPHRGVRRRAQRRRGRRPDARADAAASDARRAAGAPRPARRHPVHGEGQLPGPRADRRGGSPAFADLVAQRDAFVVERLRARGRRPDRPDQHAADGQRRHAARRLRSRREPVQRGLSHGAVRLGLVERLRHRDRGEVLRVRTRRGDLVVGPRARVEQRAVRLHAVARRDLGARQLAARADDGRRRAAHPHDGRPARGARRHRRRRPGDPRRLLAGAAVGVDSARRRVRPASYPALAGGSRSAGGQAVRRAAHVHQRRPGRGRRRHRHRRTDRPADRDPAVGGRAVRRGATRPAGRGRRGGRRRLPGRHQLRGRPGGRPDDRDPRARQPPSTCAARSSTCRRGRGTTSSPPTAIPRSTGSPTSTAAGSSRTRGRAARSLRRFRRRHRRVSGVRPRQPDRVLPRHPGDSPRACTGSSAPGGSTSRSGWTSYGSTP